MAMQKRGEITTHFGPRDIHAINLGEIRELEQVRSQYDPARLEELADALTLPQTTANEQPFFHLEHPITVARLDDRPRRQYIHDHADFYHLSDEQREENMTHTQPGDVILIAGHRRRRAIGILATRHNISLAQSTVSASVHDNIAFSEALSLQLRENIHERPFPYDEARAIHHYHHYLEQRDGQTPTIRRIAQELGFGEGKVSHALAFASLPHDVQELTFSGLMPYSTVRRFKGLYDAYRAKYNDQPDDSHAHDMLMSDVARLLRTRLTRSDARANQWIETRTKEVRAENSYQQDAFFELESSPRARRQHQTSLLADEALRIIRFQIKTGDLSPDALTTLTQRLDDIV